MEVFSYCKTNLRIPDWSWLVLGWPNTKLHTSDDKFKPCSRVGGRVKHVQMYDGMLQMLKSGFVCTEICLCKDYENTYSDLEVAEFLKVHQD